MERQRLTQLLPYDLRDLLLHRYLHKGIAFLLREGRIEEFASIPRVLESTVQDAAEYAGGGGYLGLLVGLVEAGHRDVLGLVSSAPKDSLSPPGSQAQASKKIWEAAAKSGHLAILQWAHEQGAHMHPSTLAMAALGGHLEVVRWLYQLGIVRGPSPFRMVGQYAARGGHSEVLAWAWTMANEPEEDRPVSKDRPRRYWLLDPAFLEAAEAGHIHILQQLLDMSGGRPLSSQVASAAARGGQKKMLLWLWEHGLAKGLIPYVGAVERGDMDMVRFLEEQGCPATADVRLIEVAAKNGHIHMLEWMEAKGWSFSAEACSEAAGHGHLTTLQWLRAHGSPWDEETCRAAADAGHLEVLVWAHGAGCPHPLDLSVRAARNGRLATLRWAHQHGCQWDNIVLNKAISSGSLETVEYIVSNGIPFTHDHLIRAGLRAQLHMLKWATEKGVTLDKSRLADSVSVACYAARTKDMALLEWLHANEWPWDEQTCVSAVQARDLRILRWLREHGCPWDESVLSAAIRLGHVEMVRYLHENGLAWSSQTMTLALADTFVRTSTFPRLEVIQYAHEQGCPWDETFCAGVALLGRLDLLKYAREHGCPWDARTMEQAALGSHIEVLQWAYDNGCPCDFSMWTNPFLHLNRALCEWARAHGHELVPSQAGDADLDRYSHHFTLGVSLSFLAQMAHQRFTQLLPFDLRDLLLHRYLHNGIGFLLREAQIEEFASLPHALECTAQDAAEYAAAGGYLDLLIGLAEAGHRDRLGLALPPESSPKMPRVQDPSKIWDAAAGGGHLAILQWAHDQGANIWPSAATKAALGGHLETLRWLCGLPALLNSHSLRRTVCEGAARGGYSEVLAWALPFMCTQAQKAAGESSLLFPLLKGHTLQGAWEGAAEVGHIHVLQQLLDFEGVVPPYAAATAARCGQKMVLLWLWDHGLPKELHPWSDPYKAAIEQGNMDMIKFLEEHGCPLPVGSTGAGELLTVAAGSAGQVPILEWLVAKGWSLTAAACRSAAGGGHLLALQWLRAHGAPWTVETCQAAANGGHLEVLAWAHGAGCPCPSDLTLRAMKRENLSLLRWAHQNGCRWDAYVMDKAIRVRNVEVLEYLVSNGLAFTQGHVVSAALRGNLSFLTWATKRGFTLDKSNLSSDVPANAARAGKRPLLEWLHANGWPWDAQTCTLAIQRGHLHILRWAHEHGCPWDEATLSAAMSSGNVEMVRYVHENGLP